MKSAQAYQKPVHKKESNWKKGPQLYKIGPIE